jgi:hypothetical protein
VHTHTDDDIQVPVLSLPDPPNPLGEMSTRELRDAVSQLLREDFCDRLAELERRFNVLMLELDKKDTAPPRSDFWDLRVLIVKKNQNNYNRIANTETVGAVWAALKLQYVGHIHEVEMACRVGTEYDGCVIHLADFQLDQFPTSSVSAAPSFMACARSNSSSSADSRRRCNAALHTLQRC